MDKQYQELLIDILNNGYAKDDRTETGTLSVFGRQIRHKMSDGFPLLTTKKMYFDGIVTELLWFLKGDTNIKYLVDNNCNIWNGDAWKAFPNKNQIPTIKEFVEKIKTDTWFAREYGELGPIYGKQWRKWTNLELVNSYGGTFSQPNLVNIGIDQISNLIKDLKTNPDSRRIMVTAWNPAEIKQAVLPPCHYGFQVWTRPLSVVERENYLKQRHEHNEHNIPTRAISLMWNQRSVDTFLGLPFNIASYGLLLSIIAKTVNMIPDELIGNLGDTHLYTNHLEAAKEQIKREACELPKIKITEDIFNVKRENIELIGYKSQGVLKAKLNN